MMVVCCCRLESAQCNPMGMKMQGRGSPLHPASSLLAVLVCVGRSETLQVPGDGP